ncbi:MAG: M1 family peptidase [Balneolaceae bacterium]|nr:MAG: M1 family peptidase [Balneolaceae bacterium]
MYSYLKTISLFLFSSVLLLSCTAPERVANSNAPQQQQPSLNLERPIPYPIDISEAYLYAQMVGTRSFDGTPGEHYWQNYASYNLHATLDPETHTVYGTAQITYTNNSPDDLDIIVVELAQNLHRAGTPKLDITEITGGVNLTLIAANGIELEETTATARWIEGASGFINEGTQLYIFPEEILESGGEMDLEFEWSFVVPERGASGNSSGRMGRSRDNLYYIGYWYPHIAVYDDVYGWFYDPFIGNAEFYHGFADYELSVTAPREWIVMGTGEFLNPDETLSPIMLERYLEAGTRDETFMIADFDELDLATAESEDGFLTWRFRSEKVRDVAFSATLESRWEGSRTPVGDLTGNGQTDFTRINTFYRDTAPLWEEQTEYARHSVTFMSDYLQTPYPWPHMTSVEGADIIGGGMEYPMMTIIGDYNTAGPTRLYGVTVHEIAHMWFPMIVSTNERRYTWIDEGHTSYHTNEANIDFFGADRFDRRDTFSGYLQFAGTDFEGEIMRRSDFHYPGPAFGVASYPKPASVLYALRGILGDELFMEAHLAVIDRWKYKHPYPWDIFNTFEDVTGKDLSWFWRAWYYETWTLDQSVAEVYQDGEETVIVIEDIGNVPMPVFLKVTFKDGSTYENVYDVEHWLQGHRTREIRIVESQQVVQVQIDPEGLFPDVNRQNNTWNF